MPGRDYAHAFALLDQSLQRSRYLNSLSAQTSREVDDTSDPFLPKTPNPKANGFAPAPFVNGQDPSFPPTPPATVPRDLRFAPSGEHGGFVHNGAHESGFSTPATNPQVLLTPENTPPQVYNRLSPNVSPPFLTASSPYTESFKTAAEDMESSNGEYEVDKTAEVSHFPSKPGRATELRGLGMDVLGNGSKHVPVLRHRPEISELDALFARENGTNGDAANLNREKTDPAWPLANGTHNNIPVLMRGLSLRNHNNASPQSQPSPDNQRLTRGDLSPVLEGSPLIGSLYDSEIKRLSGTSASSTVVEAVVIDHSTPPPNRKLRHVSKTESLRDEASPRLDRGSAGFDESPVLQTAQVIDGSSRRSVYSADNQKPVTSSPRTLRRRNETIPPRPTTAPQEQNLDADFSLIDNKRRIVSDPLRISFISIEDMTPPPPSASPASSVAASLQDPPSADLNDQSLRSEANRKIPPVAPTPPPDLPGSFPSDSGSGQSTDDSESVRRQSFGPSVAWSERSQRYDRGASPRSVKSETTENFEISEAAAVKFSSHTNNSLLVVHTAAGDAPRHPEEILAPATLPKANGGIHTGVEMATPTPAPWQLYNVDSPLRHPRTAPDPPTVTVIPPTPARDLDSVQDGTRQMSLIGRARRYSESFIQPIAGSLKRTSLSASRRRARSATRNEPDERLHPDWQPKDYWGDNGDEPGQAPDSALLDDRNVPTGMAEDDSPEKWRRMGSLRGFLIGNSLGIQRGPTNKRRHVVNLPANKRRKPNPILYGRARPSITVRDSAKKSGSKKKAKRRRGGKTVIQSWREKILKRRQLREQKLRDEHRAHVKGNIGWPTDFQDNSQYEYSQAEERTYG